jgi:hypothetical protein
MPGHQAVFRGEARDREDLDGLIRNHRRKNGCGCAWVAQHYGGDVDDAPVAVAQRPVGAGEFPHAVPACRC